MRESKQQSQRWTHNFTTNFKTILHLFKTNRNKNDEPINYEKMLEAMTQAQNAHNHDIDITVQTLRFHRLVSSDVANHSVRAEKSCCFRK